MSGSALEKATIGELVTGTPPLVEAYLSLDEQLQPNGFDLTLREVNRLVSAGFMGRGEEERELSAREGLDFNPDGWLDLAAGPYLITFSEIVNLPLDLMALGRPRSSLLRCGVSIHTAVWDAGYCGRSEALLVVHNPLGYRLQQGARLMQLVFFRLARKVGEGYQGRFSGENI